MSASTVGSLLRSTQAYCGQVCEKQTLTHGIAYYCPRYPSIPEVNQFREVIATDAGVNAAYDEAQAFFAQHELACRRWAYAVDQPHETHDAHLQEQGLQPVELHAMSLARWVEMPSGDVRILPARAMRSALRASFGSAEAASDGVSPEAKAQLFEERLDDPGMDAFVAMVGDRPAGRCALFQVGDIAQVVELHVCPDHVDGPVATSLIAHVLRLAQRLNMTTICAAVEAQDQRSIELYTSAGFTADATIVEFERQLSSDMDACDAGGMERDGD